MKTAKDPRHKKRKEIVKLLFAESFTHQPKVNKLSAEILADISKIDGLIADSAPQWPIERINKIDLAILRLAVWEIIHKNAPTKVIIDEAVELAKEYGGESSSSFVNGCLGNVVKNEK